MCICTEYIYSSHRLSNMHQYTGHCSYFIDVCVCMHRLPIYISIYARPCTHPEGPIRQNNERQAQSVCPLKFHLTIFEESIFPSPLRLYRLCPLPDIQFLIGWSTWQHTFNLTAKSQLKKSSKSNFFTISNEISILQCDMTCSTYRSDAFIVNM